MDALVHFRKLFNRIDELEKSKGISEEKKEIFY